MSVGNIIGANVIDLTMNSCRYAPQSPAHGDLSRQDHRPGYMPVCLGMCALAVLPPLIKGKILCRWQGVLMLAAYIVYVAAFGPLKKGRSYCSGLSQLCQNQEILLGWEETARSGKKPGKGAILHVFSGTPKTPRCKGILLTRWLCSPWFSWRRLCQIPNNPGGHAQMTCPLPIPDWNIHLARDQGIVLRNANSLIGKALGQLWKIIGVKALALCFERRQRGR